MIFYTYKIYPHSKVATALSAIGKGIIVVGIASSALLCVNTVILDFLTNGTFDWEIFLICVISTAIFLVTGGLLLTIAKRIAFRAEENMQQSSVNKNMDSNFSLSTESTEHAALHGELQAQRFENEELAQKYIKKRLLTNKKGLLISAIMMVLFIVCLCVGLWPKNEEKENAVRFHNTVVSKSYAYSDIIWISNWLYKYEYGVFYIAQDSNGKPL